MLMIYTLVIMERGAKKVFFLNSILNSFSESIGLKVNYRKSMMVPINIYEKKLNYLARSFGYAKGSLPTYLGLHLEITSKSRRIHSLV